MGLVTEEVEVYLNPKTTKHYENLGYEILRCKDKRGRLGVPIGTKITIKTKDLLNNSGVFVEVKCDCLNCKSPYLTPIRWVDYNKYVHEEGKYYCHDCAINLFGKEKSNKTKLANSISFEQWCIGNDKQDILNRWDYELNNKKPSEIAFSTHKKFWFKCYRGIHKSELKDIHRFAQGEGNIICKSCNSIAQWGIDNICEDFLDKYWSEKNIISPWKISHSSRTEVWWKCLEGKHKDFYRKINRSNNYDFRCPKCIRERDESFLQGKVRLYIESLGYTILHENKCNIIPINPKTNYPLPFDNEVKELKLIIEVHGSQHYIESSGKWFNKNFDLHKRQLLDRYKKFIAYKQDYNYIAMPYWTDDKEETWKKLIDDKIKELLMV